MRNLCKYLSAGIVVCAVLFYPHCRAPAAAQEAAFSQDEQGLYQDIIRNTRDIKAGQYPLKNQINERTEIKFLPSSEARRYKIAVIVLGSKLLDKTTPTIDLVYRILVAMDLLKTFPEAVIVMSGGKTLGDIAESRVMGVIAWSRGVDTGRIILEEDSLTTLENAKFCAGIFSGASPELVFIVSRRDHLKRALDDFREYDVFRNAVGVDCGVSLQERMRQLEDYLKIHNDPVVSERLEALRKISAAGGR